MSKVQPSRARRSTLPPDGSRQPGPPGRRVGVEPRPAGPATPANRNTRNALAPHVEEIKRRHAGGENNSEIARSLGTSPTAIRAIVRGEAYKRGAPKPRRWGKRFSQCAACGADMPVDPSVGRGYCSECINRACAIITVYDCKRDPIENLPVNLRRYLQG
jgi:hypothetical protein